jgi:hypothetical protein
MRLHEDIKLFRQAIQFTSDQMQIQPIYVEKDYWVTLALYTLFSNDIGKEIVFKGGTSLSKCFKLIDRLSEDIDLIILRKEGETDSKLKAKLKAISNVVGQILPEIEIEGLTHKMGMNRKTAHSFVKEFDGDYGQIRDKIVVESTWLGYFEPYNQRELISFIGEMMLQNDQTKIVAQFGLLPFHANVLEPRRTLCEKIMSLVRFSYSENPIGDLRKKIRHTYDLHQLLKQKEFSDFLASKDFESMILKVAQDDILSFRNNNLWLHYHPNNSIFFKDLESIWPQLRTVFNGEFRNLVFGEFPDDKNVYNTLNKIKSRLSKIKWKMDFMN